ncbi:hypothetical protein DV515_00001832 [Chloebia gouldiae]|uniref:Uncharacterized protein n=1 Tax=Chloebia gouldiae TaxID=44316 RepID=A0A3L8SYL3_CHLGU|nr:hypothetical protein DV515_00001832 [Chloebia gouldiae]
MFNITKDQAKAIITICPNCQKYSLTICQGRISEFSSDVTHYTSFGHFKYFHVSIDTFSGAIFTSAHIGETDKDTIKHFLQAFSTLGIPQEIKTESQHTTGIPHSPTGQSIIKKAHRSLKHLPNNREAY